MNTINEVDIQKSIQQMEDEIKRLDISIRDKKMKSKERFDSLQRFPFLSPFIRAVLLTITVLLVVVFLH